MSLLTIFACCTCLGTILHAQQDLEKFDDLYAKMRYRDTCGQRGNDTVTRGHELLDNLQKLVGAELKPRFSGTVGMVGNEAGENVSAKIDVKITSDIGEYPLQFDLAVGISTILDKDGLKESISDVDVSLDYHPLDDLWLEVFGAAAGASNTFLGIDRRYTAGSGVILNWYFPWMLDPGEEGLAGIGNDQPAFDSAIGAYDKILKVGLKPPETKALSHIWNGARLSNQKRNAILRLALLAGFYGEIEHVIVNDEVPWSVSEQGTLRKFDTIVTYDFGNRYRLLWYLRPTIVFRPIEAILIRAESYIQFPASPSQAEEAPSVNGTVADKTDIQFDSKITLGVTVKKDTKIELGYQHISDRLPRMVVIKDGLDNDVLVEAPNQFSKVTVGVRFDF